MGVGNLEELIDDDHAIVSSATGPEYYVSIMSFVDKDLLEPGASVLVLRFENEAEELLHYLKQSGLHPGLDGTLDNTSNSIRIHAQAILEARTTKY